MRFTVVRAGLSLALLGGCAGPVRTAQLDAEHPASPAAAESPLPAPSETLAVDPSATPSADAHGVVPPQVQQPGEHATTSGGHDHAAMTGMSHGDMGHSRHAMPVTPKGTVGAPATAPAAGQLYACPMHAEVTSANPNDRCSKCGMKINKPVKATTLPAARPADQHQHDHAGGNK
jgi:hypothetical protein